MFYSIRSMRRVFKVALTGSYGVPRTQLIRSGLRQRSFTHSTLTTRRVCSHSISLLFRAHSNIFFPEVIFVKIFIFSCSNHDLVVDRLFSREWQRSLQMRTAGTAALWRLTTWPSKQGWDAEATALLKEDSAAGPMMRTMTLTGSW